MKEQRELTEALGQKRKWIDKLQIAEEYLLAQKSRLEAQSKLVTTKHLLVLQGWVGEVEDVGEEGLAQVQVDVGEHKLVLLALRLRHDLAGGRDDGRAADHVEAVLAAALGRRRHPQPVLVGGRLQ